MLVHALGYVYACSLSLCICLSLCMYVCDMYVCMSISPYMYAVPYLDPIPTLPLTLALILILTFNPSAPRVLMVVDLFVPLPYYPTRPHCQGGW